MFEKHFQESTTFFFNELCVEHLLNGIPDQDVAYDVITKRPKTIDEAINLLTWHESCKRGLRRGDIHDPDAHYQDNIYSDYDDRDSQNADIRRVNHKHFVTEERLQQFGRELRDDITKNVTKSVKESITNSIKITCRQAVRDEMKTFNKKPEMNDMGQGRVPYNKNIKCCSCQGEGHISRNCPLKENRNTKSICRLVVTEEVEHFICDGAEVADKTEN